MLDKLRGSTLFELTRSTCAKNAAIPSELKAAASPDQSVRDLPPLSLCWSIGAL